MRRVLPIFLVCGLSAVAVGLSCNTYDESLLASSSTDRPEAKNGVGWWSKTDARGCFTVGMPRPEDRPPPGDARDVGPITLAIASMRLGSVNEQGAIDPNAWQDFGFDVDGICTASETCPSEDPPPSCKAAASQLPKDGRYCRDNTFGKLEYSAQLVPQLAKNYGLNDDAFNCALCVGHYSFLIRLTGYSGLPNDDRVRVDLYPSPGLERPLPWDCSQPSWKTQPCFTPDMPWTVQQDQLEEDRGGPDLPRSRLFDDNAYVRDGYLVSRFPDDILFWFPGYRGIVVSFPVRMQKALFVGKIAKAADNVWNLTDGVIGARVKEQDVLNGFRLIGFCEDTDRETYDLTRTFVSANLDVLADGRSDPNAPCDAMSLGLLFNARQAVAGRTEPVRPLQECVRPTTGPDAGAPGGP